MNYYAFGNRLRTCRLQNGYTLNDIAAITHYSSKHIGNIERGCANPSMELLVLLSNYLNTSPDYLLQDSLISFNDYHTPIRSAEFMVTVQHYLKNQQNELQQIVERYTILS